MIHIIPLNDTIEHEELTTCECYPSVRFDNGEMLVIHNRISNTQPKNYLTNSLTDRNMKNLIDYDQKEIEHK